MRAWTLGILMAAGLAMPVSSEAKPEPPPPSTADDFRASLTRDGFTVLQVPKESIKLGDLYSADHRFQDACVTLAESAVRDQSMGESQSEAKRQRGFAPTIGLGPLKAGVRKEVMLYKFTDVLDKRHQLVARSALVPSAACQQFLSNQRKKGVDLSGWYVVQETVSASILEITCDSKEKAIGFQAEMRKPGFNPRVSLDADRSDSCFGKNTTVGVIALRHVPIAELLPETSPAAALQAPVPTVVTPAQASTNQLQGTHSTNSIGMQFVKVEPPALASMIDPDSPGKRLPTKVEHTIDKPLLFQATEVTQRQWTQVMDSNPSDKSYKGTSLIGDELPVQMVTYIEALEFCNRLSRLENLTPVYENLTRPSGSGMWDVFVNKSANGYRLPTEHEWMYAAQARPKDKFAGTNSKRGVCKYANIATKQDGAHFEWDQKATFPCNDKHRGPAPVGSYQSNSKNLYDMTGNVSEWVDIKRTYSQDAAPEGRYVLDRSLTGEQSLGGGWNYGSYYGTLSYRRPMIRGYDVTKTSAIGFRVVKNFQPCEGTPEHCFKLGEDYQSAASENYNPERAVEHFLFACNAGVAKGCAKLGYMYGGSRTGIEGNRELANHYSAIACEMNDPTGCANLGLAYEFGKVIRKDDNRAFELYIQGCRGNYARGCTSAGFLLLKKSWPDRKKDPDYCLRNEAEALLTLACSNKEPQACGYFRDLASLGVGPFPEQANCPDNIEIWKKHALPTRVEHRRSNPVD